MKNSSSESSYATGTSRCPLVERTSIECFASLTGEPCCRTARTLCEPLIRTRRHCRTPRLTSITWSSTTAGPTPPWAPPLEQDWPLTIRQTSSGAPTDGGRTSWTPACGTTIWCWKQRTPRWRTPLIRCRSANGSKYTSLFVSLPFCAVLNFIYKYYTYKIKSILLLLYLLIQVH